MVLFLPYLAFLIISFLNYIASLVLFLAIIFRFLFLEIAIFLWQFAPPFLIFLSPLRIFYFSIANFSFCILSSRSNCSTPILSSRSNCSTLIFFPVLILCFFQLNLSLDFKPSPLQVSLNFENRR